MDIFLGGFYILTVLCAVLYLLTRAALPSVADAAFNVFQRTYLVVYLLAMTGDWLQGPHVYALYESYGMTTEQIDILFVAGFGSSMIVGTITYSLCFGTGWLALDYFWEVLATLVCITMTIFILIILLWWLPISDVVSPIGFGLTEALLLIFFGLTTLALQYAYFISIKTLILIYLVTLLLPMYILMDSWLIIEGMRFTVVPIELVIAAVITLCTDFAMMPIVEFCQLFFMDDFFRKKWWMLLLGLQVYDLFLVVNLFVTFQ
ncbi:Molybdate-anion transporter [Bulinus truncatus]|nr:Molybdate-anion transporter [Bulinus truncatus]